jgi:hypothetical protein
MTTPALPAAQPPLDFPLRPPGYGGHRWNHLQLSDRRRISISIGISLSVFLATTIPHSANPIPPDPTGIAQVTSGQLTTATASWWGFDPADSTRSLQTALDSPARKLVIDDPGSPWIVTPLSLPGDKEIVFEKGVIIEAKRGAFIDKHDCLFLARHRKNLTIRGNGAVWRMHKADYHKAPYQLAEWRHALSIHGCENITVEDLTLANSGGDGIYLGIGANNSTNRHIAIRNVTCDGNNRQGISVITAENLLIENCVLRNTRGTAPQAGIDFEPNHPGERLVNCTMRNCRSENNAGDAYLFAFGRMQRDSEPVSIRLENCSSKNCGRHSVKVGFGSSEGLRAVSGTMDFEGCRFDSDQSGGIYIRGNEADGCRIRFSDCEIVRPAGQTASPAPVIIEAPRQMDIDAGNITLDDLRIRDAVSRKPVLIAASPLTRLRHISGRLRYESPTGIESITLDDKQLAEWFPDHQRAMEIPRYHFDWSNAVPISGTPPPDRDLPPFRLRRFATMITSGKAGRPLELLAKVTELGRRKAPPGTMTLTTSDGDSLVLEPKVRDDHLTYTFTPNTTGPIRLDWHGGARDTICLVRCSSPIALSAEAKGLRLFKPTGTLHFAFPSGREQCAILVSGFGTLETVRATIRNAAGEQVGHRDNIGLPHVFILERSDSGTDEIWSLDLRKASEGVLEDVSVQSLGIAPLFSPSGLFKAR